MKKRITLLLFITIVQLTYAQQSMDSLRLVMPVRNIQDIQGARFSPDGKLFLSISDTAIVIHESSSGKEVQALNGHKFSIDDAEFSPDGKLVASVSFNDRTARIWDVQTGKQIRILTKVSGNQIAFSHDGNFILTNYWKEAIIWNVKNGHQKRLQFPFEKKYIDNDCLKVKFSKDGKYLVGFINYSSDKKQVDNKIRVWDLEKHYKYFDLLGHSDMIENVFFSDDVQSIVSSSKDGSVMVWDIKTKEPETLFTVEKNNYIIGIDLFKDSIITLCSDGSVRISSLKMRNREINLSNIGNDYWAYVRYVGNNFFLYQQYVGESKLIDFQTKETIPLPGKVLDISPMRDRLMLKCGNKICLYNLKSTNVEKEFQGYSIGDYSYDFYRKVGYTNEQKIALSLAKDGFYMFNENLSSSNQSFIDTNFYPTVYVQNISPDGKYVVLTYKNNSCKIFNVETGKLVSNLAGHLASINSAVFSPDSKKVVTTSYDATAIIWDVFTGEKLMDLDHSFYDDGLWNYPSVENAAISSDGKYAVTISKHYLNNDYSNPKTIWHLWWLEYGIEIQTIIGSPYSSYDYDLNSFTSSGILSIRDTIGYVRYYQFSTQENKLIEMRHAITDTSKGKSYPVLLDAYHIAKRNRKSYEILDISSMRSFTVPWKQKYHKIKVQSVTGSFDYKFEHYLYDGFLTFFPDNNSFLTTYGRIDSHSAQIWDTKSGVKLKDLVGGHTSSICDAAVCQDGSHVLTVSGDHKTVLWDIATGKPIYERIQLQNNNWLVKLPNSPYYMCSKDASKMLHYVTPSLKVIGFEQLDPVYNRPDIVLDSIGKYFDNDDQGRIDEYRKAWEKRIDRLGLNKEMLGKGEIAVPHAEIINSDVQTSKAEKIQNENTSGSTIIHLSANDAKYALRRFNVFVNEVPLYGSSGISIAHLKKQALDTTISVPLSIGENKIQVSVMNELGLENFKYPTYVNYTPKEEVVSKTYFIGIGVNEFKDATHNLTFCEQDVRDLASAFSGKHTEITLLTNEQVTKEKILSLKELLQKTTVNDKVIISCSSHGLLDDSLNFYLATHDVDFEHPKSRGLRYEELEGLLDGIPARQKLLLLDACNSGENDKLEAGNQVLAQNQATADSTKIGRGAKAKYASTDNQKFIQMNELFVNVRNNTGSVIISAAGGQQSALEGEAVKVDGKAIQNGAFTFSILECLEQNKGKELKVNALKQYAEKRVEEITNGLQKPTSRQETMEIDWDVR